MFKIAENLIVYKINKTTVRSMLINNRIIIISY